MKKTDELTVLSCNVLKKFISFFLLLMIAFSAESQDIRLQLSITDSKGDGMVNPSVRIYKLPSGELLFQRVVGRIDTFYFPKNAQIKISVSAIAFKKIDTVIQIKTSDLFIHLSMSPSSEEMAAVTVVASKKPLMREEDDKTIVDATVLAAGSSNAFEVVEKTPGAVIDQDGNIYLTSTTPATVFINGREMKLSASDLSSMLKSLPAGSISKIEILRNPSAKFDASGSGGIINILLKKGVRIGNSGSVNIATFQGVYNTLTSGFGMNRSGEKVNSYISYQYTKKNSFEQIISDRIFQIDSTLIHQYSYTTYPAQTHYLSTGVDLPLSKHWNVSYDTRLTYNKNLSKARNNIDFFKTILVNPLATTASVIDNNNSTLYFSNNFAIKNKIDTSGSEWNSTFSYDLFEYHNNQDYVNNFQLPFPKQIIGEGKIVNRKNMFVVQSDLTLKLRRKYTLETGFKWNTSRSSSSADYFLDTGNAVRFQDLFQTNKYDYWESIGATYVQLSKTIHGFVLKPGLRFEYTDISGHQLIPTDTSFAIRRNDLFPYVYIKHPLFKMYGKVLMGSAIFRKSIRRPYYESLNPYPKYIDQFLYESGNPSLRPQFTTSYELNATFNDIPVFAIGVNDTKDIFSNVIYQDEVTKIAYRTFDNLGKNKEYYFRLVTGIPPGGKYFFYLGGVFNWNEYRGFYQNQPFNYNRSGYTLFTFHEYKFTKTFSTSMQGFLRSKALQNFYELGTFGGVFLSATKSMLKKKLTVNVSFSDVLSTNRVAFSFDRNNQLINGKRINDTHRFGINLRYSFGIKSKEEKEKKPSYEAPQE